MLNKRSEERKELSELIVMTEGQSKSRGVEKMEGSGPLYIYCDTNMCVICEI